MVKRLKTLFLPAIFVITNLLNAQTDNEKELHNRYWTYRENLRKYFTSIGERNGQGVPFSNINVAISAHNVQVDPFSGVDIPGFSLDVRGRLNVGGDITAFMAEYMGVLASEYRLLQDEGMGASDEMKAVKNELYFAINAVKRLDKYSKKIKTTIKKP